ncbi:MAG TPA: pseudouridine-5'-phosphate glycosidase [Candidatus Dormibacteraeota bacterium]|nr:pseudouridine-5'-phosphate glycosidase [Candidatus Dormibacteraeota bacterium]
METLLSVHEEVAAKLAAGGPVVGLESSVFAQGLPAPQNIETAGAMLAAIREEGAVPAAIGVLDGSMVVGLSSAQIAVLATRTDVAKVSRGDLSPVLFSGKPGATTVAATIFIAALAGIRVVATGGIGGVHRNLEKNLDISGDLTELARTPVAIICSGVKSMLDLPRTLEVLETLGVPVVGYGTDEFPAFFSRDSGLPLPYRVDSAFEAARLMGIQWELGEAGQGMSAGIVIANPAALEVAIPRADVETWIAEALDSAERQGVRGKDMTPHLLQELARRSGGGTMRANIALLIDNARLAARIAVSHSVRKKHWP